ncbi:hypothetical protein KQX54_018601 [Cotesia glomerata]|uniref:Uncharacterized protein n=1 Tax=Cotesia glomerata TaxID=32391 RepID=A0AAV7IDD8_COTGL|nr:hypothetical protein KQX54_018601 [Cotesia glomerata]
MPRSHSIVLIFLVYTDQLSTGGELSNQDVVRNDKRPYQRASEQGIMDAQEKDLATAGSVEGPVAVEHKGE